MWYTNMNNSSKVIKSIIYVFCNFQIERERKKEREREREREKERERERRREREKGICSFNLEIRHIDN